MPGLWRAGKYVLDLFVLHLKGILVIAVISPKWALACEKILKSRQIGGT